MCAEGTQRVGLFSADTFPDIPFLMTSRLIPSGSVQTDITCCLLQVISSKINTTLFIFFMKLHFDCTEIFYYQGQLKR